MDRNQPFHHNHQQPPRHYGNNAQLQQPHHQQFAPFQQQPQQPQQHRQDLQPPRPPQPQDVQHQDPLHMAALQALDLLRMHSPSMVQDDISAFWSDVELLMSDCSQANIQAGKSWVAQNCHNPQQIDLVARAIVAIAISRKTFEEKLHLLYLVNDILSHSDRKQLPWIKDAFCPHLVAILRVAYYIPGIDDSQRQRVIKVLDIWRNRAFFPQHVLDTMEMDVKRPPLLPGAPAPPPHLHNNPTYAQPQQPPVAPHAGPWPSLSQQSQPRQEAIPYQSQQQQQHQIHPQFHQSSQPPPPAPANFQQHSPPAPAPTPAPAFRDAVTKDLPAALMASRIDSEARFYEPMPTEVSIPLKRDESKHAAVLGALADFLAEEQSLSTAVRMPGDDGWHQGALDKFHDTVLWRRKQAFSKDLDPDLGPAIGTRTMDSDPLATAEVEAGAGADIKEEEATEAEALAGAGVEVEVEAGVVVVALAEIGEGDKMQVHKSTGGWKRPSQRVHLQG
ncbi:hypothetical protein EMPS_05183 [Entomortierella parvispora]|uniref:CID domain-containing protein n=1 Tax=Entomortierella parvispora TaxID=205924 RepID=A0A9P3H9Y6_9FUNG|nr:hypothetical protein EMPS_05183 [Entomortierella parvispora]